MQVVEKDGNLIITIPMSEFQKKPDKELDLDTLNRIVKIAAECCHRLRFNNKLWADGCMKPLEDAMKEVGVYTPPVYQG